MVFPSRADPAAAIGAITFVMAAFTVVAWLCRSRPKPAVERPTQVERHLVELTATGTAAEAERLAARLRERGIVALANAAPAATPPPGGGGFRSCVEVIATDLERARAMLEAEQTPEGDAPRHEVESLLDGEHGVDATVGHTTAEPGAWFGHRLVRGEAATLWAVRLGLFAVVVGWIAVVVSAFV